MKRDIKNANGKCIGHLEVHESMISICNGHKPRLDIVNADHIQRILGKDLSLITELYDDYKMTIAEIAALYCQPYFRMSNIIKTMPVKTGAKSGRRNSSYGLVFTEQRINKMSVAQSGRPATSTYVRTPEIRAKISNSLKDGYKTGRIVQDPALKSKAWADGKYAYAKMGRGIQGFFNSVKMKRDMYFRSLLELKYLVTLENSASVVSYQMEPFQVKLPHGAHYTPDLLVNNEIIVELKPKTFDKYTDLRRFCIEMSCLNHYCQEHDMGYVVVYDTDIGFDSREYRKHIREHPEILQQYNIRFKKPI